MNLCTLTFQIDGNAEHRHGNPMPYTRTLSNHYTAQSDRYKNYQEHVRAEFQRSVKQTSGETIPLRQVGFPFTKKALADKKIRVDMDIYFVDDKRGDIDNCLKSVLDSLFEDDKPVLEIHAIGHPKCKEGIGKIIGTIEIYQ